MGMLNKTRDVVVPDGQLGGGFAGSFLVHAALAGAIVSMAWFTHKGQNWGASNNTASAIQATMVNSIPLPPKPNPDQNSVLATETPSPAPTPPAPKTVETPKPEDIPIPVKKPVKPPKIAEKTTPPPPMHPAPTKPQPAKATMGEAAPPMAMSSVQNRAGTSSVNVPDPGFGNRFPWYVQQITQKVASQWYANMLDQQAHGHRVYITFTIARDGTPSDVRIAQPSGDGSLDQTALSAVRHVDTFGPLPDAYAGSHIDVTYYFDPPR